MVSGQWKQLAKVVRTDDFGMLLIFAIDHWPLLTFTDDPSASSTRSRVETVEMVSGQWKQLAQIVRPDDFGALLLIDH
jgi:hypothetical protein